jgi:hypothetical protein
MLTGRDDGNDAAGSRRKNSLRNILEQSRRELKHTRRTG